MGRWVPGAQGRLIEAAMELYGERGYEQTTVAEIAQRAGLTERTFFRYFTDKREVLFFGIPVLENRLTEAIEGAPADTTPIDAVRIALETIAQFFTADRSHSKRRQAIIDSHPELQERERNKLATLASTMATALLRRGVRESTATIAAEMGAAVFKVAFARWLRDEDGRESAHFIREAFAEIKSVSAGAA